MPCQNVLECGQKNLDFVANFHSALCNHAIMGQSLREGLPDRTLRNLWNKHQLTNANASCDVDDRAACLKSKLCGIDCVLLCILCCSAKAQDYK